jgi:hypothetical protein
MFSMYAFLRVGTIFLWLIAIGSEYVTQVWTKKKQLLNWIAMASFALALMGEYCTYRIDIKRDAELISAINLQGIPAEEWFQAKDGNNQTFTISADPIDDSVEVLINGLIEPNDIFRAAGRNVTISTQLSLKDSITIKYRHAPDAPSSRPDVGR